DVAGNAQVIFHATGISTNPDSSGTGYMRFNGTVVGGSTSLTNGDTCYLDFAAAGADGSNATVTAGNLPAETGAVDATAGCVGEYVTASASGVSFGTTSGTVTKTVTSISLTAGDWDVSGAISFDGTATGSGQVSASAAGTSTTNNTIGTFDATN